MVVTTLENSVVKGFVIGNTDAAPVDQDACFDLPVGKVGAEGKRDILVHGLEGLKNERIAGRGRFNEVGEGHINDVDEEGWGKESDSIVVIICLREEVRAAGEGICYGCSLAPNITDLRFSFCFLSYLLS